MFEVTWLVKKYKFSRKDKKKYPKLDDKFLFINQGYNLRPLDITAAIGLNQFKRLNEFIKKRKSNRLKIISALKKHKKWNNQFYFFKPNKLNNPSWFGLPILMNKIFSKKRKKFLNFLHKNGIENRPILSGNFTNQPSVRLFNLATNKKFSAADIVEKQGFFIGLPTSNLSNNKINYLINKLLHISEI
jgi:CDP-6-deoxy-D-xylo-4-hexulose-3-dehydrase